MKREMQKRLEAAFPGSGRILKWLRFLPRGQDHGEGVATTEPSLRPDALRQRCKALLDACKETLSALVANAVNDGLEGIPAAESLTPCRSEILLTKAKKDGIADLERLVEHAETSIRFRIDENKALPETDRSAERLQKRQEILSRQAESLAEKRVGLVAKSRFLLKLILTEKTVSGVLTGLKEKRRQVNEAKKGYERQYRNLLQFRYKGVPPMRGVMDSSRMFWTSVWFLLSIEIIANYGTFQAIGLGDNNFAALIFAAVGAIFQALSAKALGAAYVTRSPWRIAGYFILTLSLSIMIGLTRWFAFGEIFETVGVIFINVVIAIMTVILGYKREKHRAYFQSLANDRNAATRLSRLDYQIDQIEKEYRRHQKNEIERLQAEAEKTEEDRLAAVQRETRLLEAQAEGLAAMKETYVTGIKALCKEAVANYRAINEQHRKTKGYAPVERWKDGDDRNRRSGIPIKVAGWLLPLCLALFGCGPSFPPSHVEVTYDITDGRSEPEIETMADFIMGYIPYDPVSENWGETTIRLSTITEESMPPVYTLKLEKSQPYWGRKEKVHETRLPQFRDSLIQVLKRITQPQEETDYSYIYRNLYYRLKALSQQTGTRTVLSWSDLFLHHPPLNFYDFLENPSFLIENRDSLILEMTRGYVLTDLSGIAFVNVHQPRQGYDALHESSKYYFRHFFEGKGMTVEFHTILPESRLVEEVVKGNDTDLNSD